MNENEAKELAREKKGTLLDSVTITMGSAAKCTAVALKCYVDLLDVSGNEGEQTETEKKVQNLFKLRQMMQDKGLVV